MTSILNLTMYETYETVSLSVTDWVQSATWDEDRRPLLYHQRKRRITITFFFLKKDMADNSSSLSKRRKESTSWRLGVVDKSTSGDSQRPHE